MEEHAALVVTMDVLVVWAHAKDVLVDVKALAEDVDAEDVQEAVHLVAKAVADVVQDVLVDALADVVLVVEVALAGVHLVVQDVLLVYPVAVDVPVVLEVVLEVVRLDARIRVAHLAVRHVILLVRLHAMGLHLK